MCENGNETAPLFSLAVDTNFHHEGHGDMPDMDYPIFLTDEHSREDEQIHETILPKETAVTTLPEESPQCEKNCNECRSLPPANCGDNVQDVRLVIEETNKRETPAKVVKETSGRSAERKPVNTRNQNTRLTYEKLRALKLKVDQAIRDHKTFTIIGHYPIIREALKQRGWVEKVNMPRPKPSKPLVTADDDIDAGGRRSPATSLAGSKHAIPIIENERMLIMRLLRDVPVNFLWNLRGDISLYGDVEKGMIVNRLPRPYFTSKVGLCSFLQQTHWFCEDGVSHILFPRCYNICTNEDRAAFITDFRLTACLGILKWLVFKYEKGGESAVKSERGKIPLTAVQFALKRCCEYISSQSHEDIDKEEMPCTWDHQWDQFLTWYYMIVHENSLFTEAKDPPLMVLFTSAKSTLLNMRKYWPQMNLDGFLNVWIVKPGNKCRGRGIQLMNRLEQVLFKINPTVMKESRYVVQKYIERPLLIHKTKFDIRQWFLVTSTHPLTVWLYKECYLRFCSQPFSLRNLHESVHLCNNAVQCKYKNARRDPALPDENMWDNYTFKTYLRAIGHADKWDKRIYPGMRESIIGTLLASQDHMDRRRNAFELFGADFMLAEDFSPWLIEINSSPCMAPTTSVTARLCPQCLEDVIKVVIDRKQNRKASTGMFEMVYRQHIPPTPPYLGMALTVRGRKIPRYNNQRNHIVANNTKGKKQENKHRICSQKASNKTAADYIGPIIVDLIEDLANQLERSPETQKQFHNTPQKSNKQDDVKHSKKGRSNTKEKSNKDSEELPDSQEITSEIGDEISQSITEMHEQEERESPSLTWHKNCDEDDHGFTTGCEIAKIESEEFLPKRIKRCNAWKNSEDAMRSMEFFNEWKQKLDRTRASCEDMLAKLKVFRESEHLTLKPRPSLDKCINWEEESINKPTISDILKKLSQTHPEKEILMYKRRPLIDLLPEAENQEKVQKRSPLNMIAGENEAKNQKSSQCLPITPHVYHPAIDKNVNDALPHIKQRNRANIPSSLSAKNRRLDNFYAVGMSLKALKAGFNQKEHLLMPLGSDHYFEMSSAIAEPMGGNLM